MRSLLIRAACLLAVAFACACAAFAQSESGRPNEVKPIERRRPEATPNKPPPANVRTPRPRPARSNNKGGTSNDADAEEPAVEPCEGAEVLVRCGGIQGCEVKVDGRMRGLTNDKGELLVEGVARGTH